MKIDAMRAGQQEAFNVILKRIGEREPKTSIVLPTRYGKSDLMRAVSYQAVTQVISSGSIALSPGHYLRNQLVDPRKVRAMCERYDVWPLRDRVRVMELATEYRPFANGEVLLSATMQLATRNIDLFAQLCDYHRERPLVIHIDECQETSEIKKRGRFVDAVTEAGALVVLYTATAIRADNEVIPGFSIRELSKEDVKRFIATPINQELVKVDVYEGIRRVVELEANHETTFREAWDEVPSPICQLSREVVDVELTEIGEDSGDGPQMLSSASPSAARRYLSKAVRHPVVIQRAVNLFCDELSVRKRVNSRAAGIIFTCNDDGTGVNAHAKEIDAAIRSVNPEFQVEIVTQKNEEGDAQSAHRIKAFVGDDQNPGKGDVLIVKQMGGAGLDCERLKVLLDLSPVRTVASVVQRLMRVATPWGATTTAGIVTLADPIMSGIWEKFVVAEGGESVFSGSCDDLDLVDSYIKEKGPDKPQNIISISDAGVSGFDDHKGHSGDMSNLEFVNDLIRRIPILSSVHTKAELSVALQGFGSVRFDQKDEERRSVDEDIAALRELIVDLTKGRADSEVFYGSNKEANTQRKRDWINAAKSHAGIPLNIKLSAIVEKSTLTKMVEYLQQHEQAAA